MVRRSKEDWAALLQAQKASGLNQTQFCQEHGLNPKYFSLRKKQILGMPALDDKHSNFVRLRRVSKVDKVSTTPIIVRFQSVELELPAATAPFIAELIQCLA